MDKVIFPKALLQSILVHQIFKLECGLVSDYEIDLFLKMGTRNECSAGELSENQLFAFFQFNLQRPI